MSSPEHTPATDPLSSAHHLRALILGFQATQLLYVAAKLGIADRLKAGPQWCEELAQAVGAHPRALYRVMRRLASLDIFAEQEDGRFALTPLATALQSDAPGAVRDVAIMYGDACLWQPYGALLHSVQTGEPAFDHLFGAGLYDYLAQHAEAAASFHRGMAGATSTRTAAILNAYDFSGIDTLVDVGGGHGAFLTAVLTVYPAMQGILFDLPHAIEEARSVVASEGVADRCRLIAGNHLQSVPSGGDAYILKSVIEDADDERAVVILQNCRQAMGDGGKLLLIDWVIPSDRTPSRTTFSDITMLVMTGGVVRTVPEFRALLEASGFRLSQIIPTASEQSILEARPG